MKRIQEKILKVIADAARNHMRVHIKYQKMCGDVVTRQIAPYSLKDGYLWVTDTKDGNKAIKSLRFENVLEATPCKEHFIPNPEWPIEF